MGSIEAQIVEIFSSLQGEGPYTGESQTFVRFGNCSMRCRYCDTPQGLCHKDECLIESPPRSLKFKEISNPVGLATLMHELENYTDGTISVTGGEPLEQAGFLAEWLPLIYNTKKILLETNGVHFDALSSLLPYIHIISMDLKLPSASGSRPMWNEHAHFLNAAIVGGREIYVKMIVTEDTSDNDIQNAIDILTRINKFIPVIIQPASPTLTFNQTISEMKLKSFERLCQAYLTDVRVQPQMHKKWEVL